MQKKWTVIAILLGIGLSSLCHSESNEISFVENIETERMLVEIANTIFGVEVARTPEEKSYGLMFRQNIPPKTGMIFLNEAPQLMGVWMKNTFVSLDVLFFDENKKVIGIFENLKPLDETPHRLAEPALGMLELPAGTVKEYKIKIGDKMTF